MSFSNATDPALLRHLLTYPEAREAAVRGSLVAFERSGGLIAVKTVDGAVRGSLGLKRHRWPWSGAAILADEWLYVEPGAAGAAVELVRLAAETARVAGLPLYLFQSSGDRPEAFTRLMRGIGGAHVGGGYRFG